MVRGYAQEMMLVPTLEQRMLFLVGGGSQRYHIPNLLSFEATVRISALRTDVSILGVFASSCQAWE